MADFQGEKNNSKDQSWDIYTPLPISNDTSMCSNQTNN